MGRLWGLAAGAYLAAALLFFAGQARGAGDVPQMTGVGRAHEDDVPEMSEAGRSHEGEALEPVRFIEPAPDKFTPEEEAHLAEMQRQLRAMQDKFLTADLSKAETEFLAGKAGALLTVIKSLTEKKNRWQAYIEGRPAADANDVPEISDATANAAALDVRKFNEFVTVWIGFYRTDMKFDSAGNAPPASAMEWMRLAKKFQEISRMSMSGPIGNRKYILRALLLEARSMLSGSFAYMREGDSARQLDAYVRGLDVLEWLASQDWGDDEMLPAATRPYDGCDLYGCDDSRLYPRLVQMKTSVKARELLSRHCPWGLKNFLAMRAIGLVDGLDWRILVPVGGREVEYLSEAPLRVGVPTSIEADMKAFADGRFVHFGKEVRLEWLTAPKTTYSVWFFSPVANSGGVAPLVDLVSKAVTLAMGGPFALLLDIQVDLIGDALSDDYSAVPMFAATGTAEDTKNFKLHDEAHVSKQLLGGAIKSAKGWTDFFQVVLERTEKNEMENLFDGIDPEDGMIPWQMGNPKTYDGGHVPPVLIRADAIGLEKTPVDEYPRSWRYVRYYQYDARLMSGLADYDLSKYPVKEMKYLSRYLAGDESVSSALWRPLVGGNRANDARLYVTDFSPKAQVLKLFAGQATTERWTSGLKKGEVIAAMISDGAKGSPETVMGEVTPGKPLDMSYGLFRQDLPVDKQIISAIGIPYGWFSRLYKTYLVRFVKCTKTRSQDGKVVYTQAEPATAEKEQLIVRFAPGPNGEKTGKVSYALETSTFPGLVVLEQTLTGGLAEMDRTTSAAPVLKQLMTVVSNQQGQVTKVGRGIETILIEATVTPVEPGAHHMTAECKGYTYHLWSRVDRVGSAAVFRGAIPAHPGRYDVTLRYGSLAPYTFTVEKEGEAFDYSGPNGQIARAQQNYNNAKSADSRAMIAAVHADGVRWLAQEYHKAGEYAQAMQCARQVLDAARQAEMTGNSNTAAKWQEVYMSTLKQMCKTTLFTGDGQTCAQATQAYMAAYAAHWQKANVTYGASQTPEKLAMNVAQEYAYRIHDAITAGAQGQAVEALVNEYLGWRQRGGAKELQYNASQFYYGQEMPAR